MKVVFGANCTWWDTIDKVGHTRGYPSLPGCPHCGRVLFEMDSEEHWFGTAQTYEDNVKPGYVAMVKWLRGKCFPNYEAAEKAYDEREDGDSKASS